MDLSFARTDGISMLVFLFTWQVRHQSAVKSTSTGRPAAWAAATASGLQRCQSIPSADSFSEPVTSGAATGWRQCNWFSSAKA